MAAEVRTLLARARAEIDRLDYSDARSTLVKALEVDASSAPTYELLGELFVEQAHAENARIAFGKAIEVDGTSTLADDHPERAAGFAKFLWMGQLSEAGGREALAYYEEGVSRLAVHIATRQVNDSTETTALTARLASAYSAMAELFMTDLCMEPEAEARCENYVGKALLADAHHCEALQTMASMRLSQQRPHEARSALVSSLELWLGKGDDAAALPVYGARLSLTRLLLECEMLDEALKVLEGLEREDDESVELWYLFGWTYVLLGERILPPQADTQGHEKQVKERTSLWEDARDCLKKCEKLYRAQEYDDQALRDHASDLLALVHASGISLTPRPDANQPIIPGMPRQKRPDEDEEEDDFEDWDSEEDDEEGEANGTADSDMVLS
ncbi:hypothetical protein PYCC9005_005972 [Savitreella phatthalungensis]